MVGIDPNTEAWPVGPQADPSSATKQVVAVKEAFNLGRKQWKGMVDMGQKMSTFPTWKKTQWEILRWTKPFAKFMVGVLDFESRSLK